MKQARHYVKKPVAIQAIRFVEGNEEAVKAFLNENKEKTPLYAIKGNGNFRHIHISTLEGVMQADLGDWIIRGIKGEYYPCKDDIFEQSYSLMDIS